MVQTVTALKPKKAFAIYDNLLDVDKDAVITASLLFPGSYQVLFGGRF